MTLNNTTTVSDDQGISSYIQLNFNEIVPKAYLNDQLLRLSMVKHHAMDIFTDMDMVHFHYVTFVLITLVL